ncbi:MAG: DEAD/DEAH box helicase, partial [Nitrosarchaeum sp.]|nr:DEAD/DEAH box helicase [Nitrosarchaeum sp.]
MKDHNQIQQKNQFPDSILDSLFAHFGFTNLTEIQKKASPIILQKKDCLVIAPTGSGKTECSVIPIFSLVKKSKKLGKIKVLY